MQHKKKERSEPGGAPAFVGPPGAAYPPGPPAPGGNYVYLTTPGGIPQAIPANRLGFRRLTAVYLAANPRVSH